MKDIKGYALVGIVVAIIIYMIAPHILGNKIQIIESSQQHNKSSNGNSYSKVFEEVNESVVSIYTRKSAARKNIYFIDPREKALKKKRYSLTGQGSGVIISAQGHIITNFHVIAGSEDILVKDHEGNEYGTAIIGIDPLTDLAVLKINKESSGITLGNINDINIGDIALAIGNPLGVGQTITLGIISATDKEISPNAYSYQRYVQTDAAINPGNSGGALVNSSGELIGINTSIISVSGGADGIGFAIPIDIVKYVFKEIINNGEVIRGYVGISAEIDYKGLGVLVKGVIPDSPADVSGIRSYDIIKKIDGNAVTEIKSVQKIIGSLKPGQIVDMQVEREGKLININILVSKMYYQ